MIILTRVFHTFELILMTRVGEVVTLAGSPDLALAWNFHTAAVIVAPCAA